MVGIPPLLSLTYFHLVGICVFWVLTNFGASWNSRKRQRRCVKDGWVVGWAQEGLDEEEVHNGELVSVRESLVTMGERSERTTHRLLRTPRDHPQHHLWGIVSASHASATANSSFSYWHSRSSHLLDHDRTWRGSFRNLAIYIDMESLMPLSTSENSNFDRGW